LFGPVSIVIPPLFFYLSRIGNSFPKRVLIRKKPSRSDSRETLGCQTSQTHVRPASQ
jgi:hypothetical protein